MNQNESMIYLRTEVKPILTKLFEEIGMRRPDDIVNFSIEWLKMNNANNDVVPEEEDEADSNS